MKPFWFGIFVDAIMTAPGPKYLLICCITTLILIENVNNSMVEVKNTTENLKTPESEKTENSEKKVKENPTTFGLIDTSEELLEILQSKKRTILFMLGPNEVNNKEFNSGMEMYFEEMILYVNDLEAKKVDCTQNASLCNEIMGKSKMIDQDTDNFTTKAVVYEFKRNEKVELKNSDFKEFLETVRF